MLLINTLGRPTRRDVLRTIGAGGIAAMTAGKLGQAAGAVESDAMPGVALEWLGAWSSDDPPRNIAALYDAEGSYGDVALGASVLGPEIEDYLRGALAGLTLLNRYPRTMFAVNGIAVAEQLYWATNQGFIPDAPAGAEFKIYAITIFEHDGRALLRTTDYYDFASILNQLNPQPVIPYGDCKSG